MSAPFLSAPDVQDDWRNNSIVEVERPQQSDRIGSGVGRAGFKPQRAAINPINHTRIYVRNQ